MIIVNDVKCFIELYIMIILKSIIIILTNITEHVINDSSTFIVL